MSHGLLLFFCSICGQDPYKTNPCKAPEARCRFSAISTSSLLLSPKSWLSVFNNNTHETTDNMALPPVARRQNLQETTATTEETNPTTSRVEAFFSSSAAVYGAAAALRIVLLVYGLWQDANSPVKYTDIDYLVFTDAARFVAKDGGSPYDRETYRYTPLLAWLLLPTAVEESQLLFASGKVLFAVADLVAGCLLERVLRERLATASSSPTAATVAKARLYASVWLLNPMVAAISTRGSAEGLLGALVAALLWAVQVARQPLLAGLLLGAGVHLKIYPFIYAPAIVWWMDSENMGSTFAKVAKATKKQPVGKKKEAGSPTHPVFAFLTPARLQLTIASLATFVGLNLVMYSM